MSSIVDILKAIIALVPALIELIKALKGQPKEVQQEALRQMIKPAKDHCEGVACEAKIKKDS